VTNVHVRQHWPLVAIIVAWPLLAGAIFLSGKWVGETNAPVAPYSDCTPIDWTGRPGFLCFEPEPPAPARGAEA